MGKDQGQAEAARRFGVSPWCVRDWRARQDLRPEQKGVSRQRKLDLERPRAQVRQHPDATLREHAAFCGVDRSVVGKALKRMRIIRKKRPSSIFKYKERDPEKRLAYLRTLRQRLAERGSADGVYIDESGFEPVPLLIPADLAAGEQSVHRRIRLRAGAPSPPRLESTGPQGQGFQGDPNFWWKGDFFLGPVLMSIALNPIPDRFAERTPIPVMARSVLGRCLNAQQLDAWFKTVAEEQYTRNLLFSTVFDLMTAVVFRQQPSVNAACQARSEHIGVSATSVYNKLNGLEPAVTAGLVNFASDQAGALIEQLGGAKPPPLPGWRMKVLDGHWLGGREHRLKELRALSGAPLPGKSVAVFDPALEMFTDLFPREDDPAPLTWTPHL